MRKVFSVALMAGMLCLVGMTKDAGASVTIDLEWGECGGGTGGCTATGSDTISVNAGGGQTLRLDIFLSHDLTQGLKYHTFSVNSDTSLDNELNLGPMAQAEWGGTDVDPSPFLVSPYSPLTTGVASVVESTGAVAGRINSIESGAIVGSLPLNGALYTVGTFTSTAPAPARYRIGQAFFTANGATTDGADVFSGLFAVPFDFFVDGNSAVIPVGTITFGTATLNIPEPGTVSLLGLGLVGLILASRRSRA